MMIARRKLLVLGAGTAALAAVGTRLRSADESPAQPATPRRLRQGAPGQITVDSAVVRGEVSSLLFGCGLEWTDHGNFIYDPATHMLRREVLDALATLRIPVWRFPGGIMADHYHWRDGIGAAGDRPIGVNPMDGSRHRHTFGTDEFIALVRELSADALVTANVGTGTYEELEAWADHFKAAGRPVAYWELGNELYLAEDRRPATIPGNDARIFHKPQAYAAKARTWANALKKRYPDAKVGAVAGTSNVSRENAGWLDVLLSDAIGDIDFIALHNAFAPLIMKPYDYSQPGTRQHAYNVMSAQVQQSLEDSRAVAGRITAATGGPAYLAITEHFPLFGTGGDEQQIHAILDQSRTMAAALYTAGLFHAWMRAGLWMANYNLATSRWFGALLTDTDDGLIRTPTYHVYDLYRNQFGSRRVDVTCIAPMVRVAPLGVLTGAREIPLLDSVAAVDASGTVTLSTICRSFDQPVDAVIEGIDAAIVEVRTLGAEHPNCINGPSLTPTTRSSSLTPVMTRWNPTPATPYSFPPNSVTLMRWQAAVR